MPPPLEWNYAGIECARIRHYIWNPYCDWISGRRDEFPVTCPVSRSGVNDWGLYGVGGNVWEWCGDWLDTTNEQYRAVRGGAWDSAREEELIKRMEAQCDADRGGIESLARQLRDGSVPERRDAADRLCRLGAAAASAIPALMQAVESDDWQTGVAAIEALGAIGLAAEPAVPVLSDVLRKSHLLETQSNARCRAAARSLGQIGSAAMAALRRIPAEVGDNLTVKGAIRDVLDEADRRASLPGDGRKESLGRPRWIPAAQ
jgi:hypothetical protein